MNFFYGDPSRAETLQKQTETPVVDLAITDISGKEKLQRLYEIWQLLGEILGKESRASELATFMEETIDDLGERTADLSDAERATAYAGAISYKGAQGVATTRRQFPPFTFTNVENVASGLETDAASVLLLDEPTSALDLKHQLDVMVLIVEHVSERDVAGLVAIHDVNLAARYCDRIALLFEGEIYDVGGPDVLTPETIRTVYGVEATVQRHDGHRLVGPESAADGQRAHKAELTARLTADDD